MKASLRSRFLSISLVALLSFGATSALAADLPGLTGLPGLTIDASEWGVGKFHREDNKVHAYPQDSAWKGFVLPQGKEPGTGALVINNGGGSFSITFSTLDELISEVTQLSAREHLPVRVFNLHGHGLPGAMWFPATQRDLQGFFCDSWLQSAKGADSISYNQYYSAVSVDDILQIRRMSQSTNSMTPCTTGLREWTAAIAKAPAFKNALANDVQIHLLSCVVGLGKAGEAFTEGLARLLLTPGTAARVEASVNFGLGDWSMPEGMGFWDYQTKDQVERDNALYGRDKTDREIAQKGTIRMVSSDGGQWRSTLLGQRDFMSTTYESTTPGTPVLSLDRELSLLETEGSSKAPVTPLTSVRIPGTTVRLPVLNP